MAERELIMEYALNTMKKHAEGVFKVDRKLLVVQNAKWKGRSNPNGYYSGRVLETNADGTIPVNLSLLERMKATRVYFVDVKRGWLYYTDVKELIEWARRVGKKSLDYWGDRKTIDHLFRYELVTDHKVRLSHKDNGQTKKTIGVDLVNSQSDIPTIQRVAESEEKQTYTSSHSRKTFITVRTQFQGIHRYPNASKINPRIAFLEVPHRHLFKVEVTISVSHLDRELEFFLVKWALEEFIEDGDMNNKICEMIGTDILDQHLLPLYGDDRYYKIIVSEDGESDGVVVYEPAGK
jgi:hypothetical protein